MNEYTIPYAIFPCEDVCAYKSAWCCVAVSLAAAKAFVKAKLKSRYPHCEISI